MQTSQKLYDPVSTKTTRRLALGALAIAAGAVAIEALLLDSSWLAADRSSFRAVLSVALQQAKPYLMVALSLSICGWVLSRYARVRGDSNHRPSWIPICASIVLATVVCLRMPTLEDSLLNEELQVNGTVLATNGFGPLAVHLPLQAVPLEEVGRLAEVDIAPASGPRDLTVRWQAIRTAEPNPNTRVELIGGGNLHDVSHDYRSLPLGKAVPLERSVRLGPGPNRIRLRLAWDPPPPTTFFSSKWDGELGGFALDTGGDDFAVRKINEPINSDDDLLVISGTHTASGYTTIVLSGMEWRSHDLATLVSVNGALEVILKNSDPSPWSVRLVGHTGNTMPVPLTEFRSDDIGDERVRYTISLNELDWTTASPGSMVGAALLCTGRPGPFRIEMERVRAIPELAPPSCYALGATRSAHSGGPPVAGLMAAGMPQVGTVVSLHPQATRLAAALMAVIGLFGGLGAMLEVLRRQWTSIAAAALVGPTALLALDAWLPEFMTPRPEQVPLALILGIVIASVGSLRAPALIKPMASKRSAPIDAGKERARVASARLSWADAAKMAGILGIIGFHVTADVQGQAFGAFEQSARWVPVIGRVFCQPFNSALFVIASFFLLAYRLDKRPRDYAEVMGRRSERLLVPFALWSLIFLIFRHWKASVFGYQDAYREHLADGLSWLGFTVLGSAQYHLHFLPFLLGLTLLYPLYRIAKKRPWLALLALPALLVAWSFLDGIVYRYIVSAELRPYLLRATKTLGFAGFGVAGFAMHKIYRDRLGPHTRFVLLAGSAAVLSIGLAILAHHSLDEVATGRWLPLGLAGHLARHLLPVATFALFMLVGNRLSGRLGQMCKLNFGVFLVHPIILDALEIMERGTGWPPALTVPLNFFIVAVGSFGAAWLISRTPWLRWTIGLKREAVK